MLSHHPAPELLFDYAAGSLREVHSLLVASHLVYCPECRRQVADLEACGGALLEEVPAEPVSDALLDKVMARLSDSPATDIPAAAALTAAEPVRGILPGPLRRAIGAEPETLDWVRIVPGIHLSTWAISAGTASACLLRMGPRRRVPAHRHTDNELLLVLKGGLADEHGRYGVGDVATYEPNTPHHAIADPDGDCLCLLVQDQPLVFTGPLGWLLNRGFRF